MNPEKPRHRVVWVHIPTEINELLLLKPNMCENTTKFIIQYNWAFISRCNKNKFCTRARYAKFWVTVQEE